MKCESAAICGWYALVADSEKRLRQVVKEFGRVYKRMNRRVNESKRKMMVYIQE